MIKTEYNVASSRKTHGFSQMPYSQGANSMSMSDQTEATTKPLRLLLPINACEDSRWSIQYALQRHREGASLEVILLNIGEPVTQWQVLRFRTQQEIAQFQSDRAQAFIEEATRQLVAEEIPCRGLFKQGELVFSILDTAEELDCDEIIMPTQKKCLASIFSDDTVSAVRRQQRDVPVVIVNREGVPV